MGNPGHFYVPDNGWEEVACLKLLEGVGQEERAQEQQAGHQERVGNIVAAH